MRNRANKNAAENGDGAKYSLRSYSEQQLRNWENSKRIVVYSSEAQLREFIKDARAGRIGGRKMYFGMVPQNLAQKIMSETGINVDGYNCSLSAYEIQKIFKDHGNAATERLRGQRAVTEDDVAAIPEILQDADTIVPSDKKYNGKPAIQFTKNGNGRVNLVAVVSDKHLDLFVQTMYAGIKKGNLATPTGEQAPINTPEASRSTVSNNSIRSSSENSNTKIKKSERDAEYLSAVKRGDLETARNMVNEAAEDAEYDITAYHVSMNGAFNVFDRNRLGENTVDYADDAATAATAYLGFWFSDHDVSKPTRSYGMIPGDARQFRLKAEILYPIALQTLHDELLNEYISEDAIEQYSAGEYSAIREAAEEYAAELQRRGYSGLEVWDSELGGTSYVMFAPEQIKSADAVVYDDNGKVIPLSERFNAKKNDIRYSARDLTDKYPQLNLNEDISELDGVPAIELTDGSVLPITERDGRYPTHVSFIEANRIDVDDLKSGGWIGNGVYDPSFTSDTQRYIERQQARKRVAELTGKQYEQFRYSMRDVTTGDTREELAQRRAA